MTGTSVTRRCVVALVVIAAGCAADDAGRSDTFNEDCAGTSAQCGKMSVRWTVDRAGVDSTCSAVAATTVQATVTFQPDGRSATFDGSCGSGAILTSSLPVGPYSVTVALADASGTELATDTTLATLTVSNVVAETAIAFNVIPTIGTGDTFGACSTSNACKNPSEFCFVLSAGHGYCTPVCTTSTMCATTYHPLLEENAGPVDALCIENTLSSTTSTGCLIYCGGPEDSPCAKGTRCAPMPGQPRSICQP